MSDDFLSQFPSMDEVTDGVIIDQSVAGKDKRVLDKEILVPVPLKVTVSNSYVQADLESILEDAVLYNIKRMTLGQKLMQDGLIRKADDDDK